MSEIGCVIHVNDWYKQTLKGSEKWLEFKNGRMEPYMPKVNGVRAYCKITPRHDVSAFKVTNNRGETVLIGPKKHRREWTDIGDLQNRIDTVEAAIHKAWRQNINLSPMIVSDGARKLEVTDYIAELEKEIKKEQEALNEVV